MTDIVILADGDFPRTGYPLRLLEDAEAVVCCDGALVKYLEFSGGTAPAAVVGDMDTLPDELKKRFADIIVKYDEQDYNDLAKAARYSLEAFPEVKRIHILGASGGQEDFTIGNFGILMEFGACHPDIAFDMISDHTNAFPLRDSDMFYCGEGRTVSVFSPDPTLRISSQGLAWPLDGVCFDNWWKGIRNRATQDRISLSFNHPAPVLIILN